jgi:hypothetical protein
MIVKEATGKLDGLSIVGTDQGFEPNEMPIAPDGISPILCHPKVP